MFKKPPRIANWIYRKILPETEKQSLNGDFDEIYNEIYDEKGRFFAWIWYWWQILISLPEIIFNSLLWSFVMFKNYFTTALRNIKKQKFYSIINLIGLALGMACFILIILYINFELSYDNFHKNAENIYRIVVQHSGSFMGTNKWVWTPDLLAPTLKENFPEVKKTARVEDLRYAALAYKNRSFTESRFYLADPDFLKIFSYELVSGNPETVLNEPFSLLLTEKMTEKYFGDENPVGKTIRLNDKYDFNITGVLKNMPENSHLKFDFLSSFISLNTIFGESNMNEWGSSNYQTYVQLQEHINLKELEKRFTECVTGITSRNTSSYILQPVTEIHLSGTLPGELEKNSEKKYIYIFFVIAVFILSIACFNYMNLSTARSAKRAMEVGMRKVIGATKKQLVKQFIGESVLYSLIAFLVSLVIVYLLLPAFNSIIDRNLSLSLFFNIKILAGLTAVTFVIGLLSGMYPAFFISSFQPTRIIKGDHKTGTRGSLSFRNSLVLIQFILSICLIISTIVVYRQLQFIRTKDAGFKRDHIITMKINMDNKELINNLEAFKNSLTANPEIFAVTISNWPPTNIRAGSYPNWEGKNEDQNILFHNLLTDYDFLDLYDVKLIDGRNFSKNIGTDLKSAYIVNETAVKIMGFENPIGKSFGYNWKPGKIIGVVKDFHFIPMNLKIIPLAIRLGLRNLNWLSIRLNTKDIRKTLSFIEEKWKEFSPAFPFDYSFIDERFDALYKEDLRQGKSFGYFTFVAIFLACLGLFGLVSFTAEQRTKEIGIRKVFGASVSKIIVLITREFIKWVLISSFIAVPAAWYAMNKWINNYAYRINLGAGTFILGIILALFVAIISVGYQAYKAAAANPIDSLRNE